MIPKPIVDVVEAARRFVRARFELRDAIRSKEMNELGLNKRRKALRDAAKALDRAVLALEERLAASAKRGAREPIPWGSVFKAVGEFAGLVSRVKAGDPTVVRDAAAWAGRHGPASTPRNMSEDDIIDAEIIEE